jgi:hypothetical protein
VPLPNAQAQSARSNQASFGNIPINRGEGTNTRIVARDSQTQQELYGHT